MSSVGQMMKHTSMNKTVTIKMYYDIKISNSKNMFGVRLDPHVIIVFYSIGWHSPLAQQPVAGQVLPPLVSGENNFCPIIFSQYPLIFVFLYWSRWVQRVGRRIITKLISRHFLYIKWRMSYWHPLLLLFSSTSQNLYLHVCASVLFQFLIPLIMF